MKRLVYILALFLVCSCNDGKTGITDYYFVFDHVEFDYEGNEISASKVLMCNPGSESDPFIRDVESVEFNNKAMIVKSKIGYFIINSNSYGLKCSCGNTTMGPLTKDALDEYKADKGLMNVQFKKIDRL